MFNFNHLTNLLRKKIAPTIEIGAVSLEETVSETMARIEYYTNPVYYKRGLQKGKINWSKTTGKRSIIVTKPEYENWLDEWKKETNLCTQCFGKGEVFKSWSENKGTIYKICPKCTGEKQ